MTRGTRRARARIPVPRASQVKLARPPPPPTHRDERCFGGRRRRRGGDVCPWQTRSGGGCVERVACALEAEAGGEAETDGDAEIVDEATRGRERALALVPLSTSFPKTEDVISLPKTGRDGRPLPNTEDVVLSLLLRRACPSPSRRGCSRITTGATTTSPTPPLGANGWAVSSRRSTRLVGSKRWCAKRAEWCGHACVRCVAWSKGQGGCMGG